MLGQKQALSREAAMALLKEAVPGALERSVERQWIMAAREAGAGWVEIEEAISWNPRPKQPGWAPEE